MINLLTYFQPQRTYLPCTGVGRHINGVFGEMQKDESINPVLLASNESLEDGRLNLRSPLSYMKTRSFTGNALARERSWKLFNRPLMDADTEGIDVFYSPVDGYVSFKRDIPKIITMHDMHLMETQLPWSNTLHQRFARLKGSLWMQRVFNSVDHLLTISNFSKERMVELLDIHPDKISVVGNGIDQAIYDFREVAGPANIESPYCVVVGGLREKKGADLIVKLSKYLDQHKKDFKIVVIGNSEEKYLPAFEEIDSLTNKGILSDEEMYTYIFHASCMLFFSHYEGFGLPVIEAMALDCPVITYDKEPFREFNPISKYRVSDQASVKEIIERIAFINELKSDTRDDLRSNFQFSKKFTWESVSNSTIQILERYI